ncbi:phage tail protein [Veronia pacifica]|uniref:Phage tail protein n=1 Tax=Veronia pacifica TaxID=1080227 RepID=A0A1C3EE71_9GAMM|nr:phage tail protein [Veronia pacifica]ODA31523.1 phage tail protein [Veronia pacifica]
MTTLLKPVITRAGLNAIFNATSNGFQAKVTHVALGEAAYKPNENRRALDKERSRFPIARGKTVTPTQIHMSVLDNSDKSFWVREVGFFLDDGTLFAVYSEPNKALAYKSPEVDLLLAFELALSGIPADSLTIIDKGAELNILIAPELAKMATAQITMMNRYLTLKAHLDEQAKQHTQQLAQIATIQIDSMRRYLTDKLQ